MIQLVYIVLTTFAIALIAFIGVFALIMNECLLNKILIILVSLSAGALMGGAFLHLLPESVEKSGKTDIFLFSWRNKGYLDQAIDDYNKAINLDAKYVTAYVNRGNAWIKKNNFDQAFADYSEAMRIDINCADAYYGMACLRAKLKNSKELGILD